MRSISVSELETNLEEILREAQESGEMIAFINHGTVVAHLIPARRTPVDVEEVRASLAEGDRLAAEIGLYLPEDVSAVEAVRDVRRDL